MSHLAYLNKYFWKYRGRLIMGFVFVVLGNVFNVYAPVIVRDGIDFLADALQAPPVLDEKGEVFVDQPQSFRNMASWVGMSLDPVHFTRTNFRDVVIRIAILLAVAYLVFYLIKGIFLFYQRQTLIVMSRYIEYDLKNEIYDKYQELDYTFYKRHRTGDLMNRISEDVNRVRMYVGPAVMYTLNLATLLIMCIVVMLQIDVELTLYTLSPLPFMMFAIFYVSTVINRRTDKVQSQQSKLSSMVQETIAGIRVLKAFRRETYFEKVFEEESSVYKGKQLRLVRADAMFMPVLVLLVGLSTILTVYIGAGKVIRGEISPGVIVQFVFYVNLLTWPFAIVGWVTSLVQKAEASQARINEFLATVPAIRNEVKITEEIAGDIEFRNVSYTYPDSGIRALDNISFHIKKGETLGIIGRTGSGKSTIANLLLRMMDPDKGSIHLDQKDITRLNLFNLRSHIGYVPQDVFLFSDTIRNNIAFGTDVLSEDSIIKAAKDSDIHESIIAFPKGYDTSIGERGINLSGGQKQRVSIARALAKNPPILVFDDCLSAVDTETEERILNSLRDTTANKTTLIVAHRISSIRNADHIIVLDRGKLVEEGNHEALITINGLYASLYRKQLLEEENED